MESSIDTIFSWLVSSTIAGTSSDSDTALAMLFDGVANSSAAIVCISDDPNETASSSSSGLIASRDCANKAVALRFDSSLARCFL